jgi:hypothetical protein
MGKSLFWEMRLIRKESGFRKINARLMGGLFSMRSTKPGTRALNLVLGDICQRIQTY